MAGHITREYLYANRKRLLKRAIIIAIAAAAVFVFLFRTGDDGREMKIERDDRGTVRSEAEQAADRQTEPKTVVVDVGGQVKEPQVVELAADSRIADAIEAAGGLTGNADLSGINRAAKVSDGEKIYIPAKGENNAGVSGGSSGNAAGSGGSGSGGGSADSAAGGSAGSSGSGASGSASSSARVNINTADSTELQTLNGVGPVTAEKIIAYREQNGRFPNIEAIKEVSGIGDKTYEKLKDFITI
ncbi:MAG: helix-hairpin-helix domain-containing protein [Anaerovoracaceae bacterium]|jgi:competence protein ComEA